MSIERDHLVHYTQQLLAIDAFQDYAPNGLQVEGTNTIRTLVSGVTACQALLQAAATHQADAVVVHHGYFWKSDPWVITGMHRQRIATLVTHNMNLLAYHLPLDAHATLGNNALLAKHLGLKVLKRQDVGPHPGLLYLGELSIPQTASHWAQTMETVLGRKPLVESVSQSEINKVAWCTGAAQDMIHQAVQAGCDAFVTGEVSERTIHIARECGIHFFAAGHHATERYGIQALGDHLAQRFQLQHRFIDIANPA